MSMRILMIQEDPINHNHTNIIYAYYYFYILFTSISYLQNSFLLFFYRIFHNLVQNKRTAKLMKIFEE